MSIIRDIEKKWQEIWEKEKLYKINDSEEGKENFYHLVMFPYPSGSLHIGHWFQYAPTDISARWRRMNGFNVLSPIGFDAFGLPAENAALQRGVRPREWTLQNIDTMRGQLKSMGAMYDWSREIVTCDPLYYRWTQWMFLQMHSAGLTDRREAPANWCPSCKTILANEQVVEGVCDRCDSPVEQRDINQWVFKITDYADRLLEDLDGLDWPERTVVGQKNWIGRSEGAMVDFDIVGTKKTIHVYTTRPDTLWGATYMVLAPEHELLDEIETLNNKDVEEYRKTARRKSELERMIEVKEKTGVDTGLKAINPVNGEEIPIWVADYVLGGYGTGAIMAVPAHDQRDFEFAKKFDLPIKMVICPNYPKKKCPVLEEAYVGVGHMVDSDNFTGLTVEEGIEKVTDWLEKKGKGKRSTQYKLRDWIVSRQRYWGCPIPIIHCEKCGAVPVPEEDLPLELPDLDDFKPSDDGRSPLARAVEWVKTECPQCNGDAERETDTMDTFVDSSWYFLRYSDPNNDHVFAERDAIDAWLPVDLYIGGAEHTVLHLLYARFLTKVLYDKKLIAFKEPFSALRHQGIILGEDNHKMSKSRGNVVDPDLIVDEVGADVVRLFLSFMGPYDQGGSWNSSGIKGVVRFLERLDFIIRSAVDGNDGASAKAVHKAVKKVTNDTSRLCFNTAIAAMMTMVNEIERGGVTKMEASMIVKIMAPYAPHRTEEWWREVLGEKESVHLQGWPIYEPSLVEDNEIKYPVQVNGKVRNTIMISVDADEETIKKLAEEAVASYLEGKLVQKIFVVKGKIVNIVVSN